MGTTIKERLDERVRMLKLAGTEKEAKRSNREPAKRWTKKLVEKGWVPVPDYFLKNAFRLMPELTSAEIHIIILLMMHKWDEKMPYPGSKALARYMGISATAVRNHLRSLHKSKKCIVRHKRIGDTNQYDLTPLFQKLEALMATDEIEAKKKEKGAA